MAFCKQCGAELRDGSKFCSVCGTQVDEVSGSSLKENIPLKVQLVQGQGDNVKPIPESPVVPPVNAIVLKSGAPIPTKTGWTTKAYIACGILVFAYGLGVLLAGLVWGAQCFMMDYHKDKMRKMKFKFNSAVTADDIYERMYPIIKKKIPDAQFDRDGNTISVSFDSIIFDILLHDDATFSLWWRKSLSGAIFSFNVTKLYKKIRTGTGLLAYELQKAYGII